MIKKSTAVVCGITMVILSLFGFYEWVPSLFSDTSFDRDTITAFIGITLILIGVCE